MTILIEDAEIILRRAREAEIGIQVRIFEDEFGGTITPSLRAKQILYRFRQEIGDVELKELQIHLCPRDPNNRLWITKPLGR